jgi:serine/threonine protein kinase/tetratricopeptide (TPR) repeat protein
MSTDLEKRALAIFETAIGREGSERQRFVAGACAGDAELRRKVETLLLAHENKGSFLASPPLESEPAIRPALVVGQRFGAYRILGALGRGGMGEVYLAQDSRLGRKVALKLLRTEPTRQPERAKRFEQEARAASALNHPNILTIHEIGQVGGAYYIVTEFIEGQTLRQRMAGERMKLQEALDVASQVANALAEAHAAGITHRDIKPENIMLRPTGLVKVLDFGLAKLTESSPAPLDSEAPTAAHVNTGAGAVLGTPGYMSPEQARGLGADRRTDIFSLGVVLYEMIAGRSPFEGTTAGAIIAEILNQEPPPLARYSREVPEALEWIVRKALAKDREERYQGVKDLALDLKGLKQRLERERAGQPDVGGGTMAARSSQQASGGTRQAPATQTGDRTATPTTSSAEYLVSEMRRHRLGVVIALAAFLVAAGAFFYFKRQPALTDKDTILLADFENKTGDEIFDDTLKQGLAVQLQQSPFLSLFPEARVRHELALMRLPPDERVTREIARAICVRQNLKAWIAGSIAPLGSHYVITLEAINGQSGETLAHEQAEADSREQVLQALSRTATGLREKLGENLSSIQRFDKPLVEATTSNLEALKAWSLGIEQSSRGRQMDAIPFYKRAVELDPDFAHAYSVLSVVHWVTGRPGLAAEYAERGYALRDRVSEYEKLRITNFYHAFATGDLEKRIEVLMLLKRMYPREGAGPTDLGGTHNLIGQYDQAIAEAREAIRLNPNFAPSHGALGWALVRLNRFAEAREALGEALQQKLDATVFHSLLYEIAFINGDPAGMEQQTHWATGKPDEYAALDWQTGAAAFTGRWQKAEEFSERAMDLAARGDTKEVAARFATEQALRAAALGDCLRARIDAMKGLDLERGRASLPRAALALALCGETHQVKSLVEELNKRYPEDSVTGYIWLPVIRAADELQGGNASQAIELLQPTLRYEAAAEFWPQYLRGQAFLKLGNGMEATAEFQKILGSRGQAPLSALYPLAHLGLARAAASSGDAAKSRQAYQDFLALWKNADPDLAALEATKQEYARLK